MIVLLATAECAAVIARRRPAAISSYRNFTRADVVLGASDDLFCFPRNKRLRMEIGYRSKSEIGATNFRIVNEFPGGAAMNDAAGFHDVTSIGN